MEFLSLEYLQITVLFSYLIDRTAGYRIPDWKGFFFCSQLWRQCSRVFWLVLLRLIENLVFSFLWKLIWPLFHVHISWCGSSFNHCTRYLVSLHSVDSWPSILGSYLKIKKICSPSLLYFAIPLWFSVLIDFFDSLLGDFLNFTFIQF